MEHDPMSLLVWNSQYSIGIQQIDAHHRHMFFLLNTLYDDFVNRETAHTISALIDELIDYATYHFAAEERWMKANGYSALEQHAREHHRFSLRIGEFATSYRRGEKNLALEILSFLHSWLSGHILQADAEFGHFIVEEKNGILRATNEQYGMTEKTEEEVYGTGTVAHYAPGQ
jgi:hemerythrin